jgi:Na+/proline symporter
MALVDWFVVIAFMAGVVGVGLWFTRRASRSMTDYFVAGRTIPWWLAGTSMLATSFASDTPLHTTRVIREQGLSGAWFYWIGIFQGVVIAFLFSRLWRRTGVVTDNEFIELRYTGRAAAALRAGLAVFKSLFLEILTMAWITLGMTKIVKAIMGLPDRFELPGGVASLPTEVVVVAVLLLLTLTFSVAAGFWGVVTTDLLEFTIAMVGAIVLCVIALKRVGGVEGLRAGLATAGAPLTSPLPPGAGPRALDFSPPIGGSGALATFGVYLGVQWWAHAGIDGSGQRAQRLLACKDERNALAAGVWSLAVTWLLRSWPWYVAALCSLVLYPHLADNETAYPRMVADLLPAGLKGLMVASFLSAFMATIEAHYNLVASYAVNDVYRRFVVKNRSDAHYVKASRWMTVAVAVTAGIITLLLPSVLSAFRFKMELMAGLGLVFVLRWFWWRINAKSEIVALGTSIVVALALNALPQTSGGGAVGSALRLLGVVVVSAAAALVTVRITEHEPLDHLAAFYRRVRPPGAWRPVAIHAGAEAQVSGFGSSTFVEVLFGVVFVLCGMLGVGKVILGEPALGWPLVAMAAVSGWIIIRRVLREKTD